MPFPPDPILATPRLLVRAVRADDLPALFEVNGDDAVTRFLPYAPWRTAADGEAWLARMRGFEATGDCRQCVIVHRELDRAIGTCLAFRHDVAHRRAEVGYVLGRAHWGRGYMQEALRAFVAWLFDAVALERLEAQLDPENAASARLLERVGFVREGVLRRRWFTAGRPGDSAVYSLLRTDLANGPTGAAGGASSAPSARTNS